MKVDSPGRREEAGQGDFLSARFVEDTRDIRECFAAILVDYFVDYFVGFIAAGAIV
jgi:hypothetical protein